MQTTNKYVQRISFSRIFSPVEVPDLLEIQKKSYKTFLQIDQLPENRKNIGIQAAFKSIFPISDFKETAILDFVSYSLGDWVCKCGALQGIENSMPVCTRCGAVLSADNETGQRFGVHRMPRKGHGHLQDLRPVRRPGAAQDATIPPKSAWTRDSIIPSR